MAIQGSYRINFTDPKNGSFVIEPYTVNGNVTPTSNVLHQKATRANTSLQLPGQYVPNYGELVHEDLVHLLENFSGDTPPTAPIEGQLWYDTGDSFSIVDLSVNGCTVAGNHSAIFGEYIAEETSLTAWYGPVSTTDNSYNTIVFKVTSVLVTVDNNTVVTITAIDGTELTFPNTAVGGFITPTLSSRLGRLKVAVEVNGALTWSDVVNVACSTTTPNPVHLQNGDLWYDLNVSQLKVYINGSWVSLTAGYLPLAGGTMAGTLNMGINPVLFSGPVNTSTTLTNKQYVDETIADAIEPLQSGTELALEEITGRVDVIEDVLPNKVSKDGDNVRGVLTFGPDGTTSTLTFGMDMVNKPIINPSITWSSSDYLDAVGETHNVVDKNYIALALKQHLLDASHGGASFIEVQPDGTGLAADSLIFADAANTLTFDVNNSSYGLGVDSSSLILYTGSWIGSKFSFRQFGSTDSLFEVGDTAIRSYHTMYLFDGQPQPTFGGAITDENEDTKVATKGYVLDAIDTANADAPSVTDAEFAYSVEIGPYNLTLVRDGGADLVVDLNHEHKTNKIIHDYQQLTNWSYGDVDLVGQEIGNPAQTTINLMLNALNRNKAPVSGAKFEDFPTVGLQDPVVSIDDSTSTFELAEVTPAQLPVGTEITMSWLDTEPDPLGGPDIEITVTANYVITSATTEVDPGGLLPDKYLYITDPALPLTHDLVVNPMTCLIPLMDDGTDIRNLMNKASVKKLVSDYVATELAADRYQVVATNTTTALTLALTHANKYLRMNNAAATALTVPPQADVTWLANTEIEVRNAGVGKVTLTAGAGVTLNAPFGKTLVMQGQGATIRLKRVAADEWDVIGDTETI